MTLKTLPGHGHARRLAVEGDEVGALRDALLRGDWTQLVSSPSTLLMLAFLEEPDTWPKIVQTCSITMVHDILSQDDATWASEVLLAWARGFTPLARQTYVVEALPWDRPCLHTDLLVVMLVRDVVPVRRSRTLLDLARRVVARAPSPEREAALTVLERWPVG